MVRCLPEAAWNHRGVCQRLAPAGCLTVLAARKITKVLKCHHFPLQTERLWKIPVASCVRVGPALKIGISLLFTACLQFNWTSVERVPEAFMGEMANCQANWLFFTEESAVMIYRCVKQLCQVAARLDASSTLPSTLLLALPLL